MDCRATAGAVSTEAIKNPISNSRSASSVTPTNTKAKPSMSCIHWDNSSVSSLLAFQTCVSQNFFHSVSWLLRQVKMSKDHWIWVKEAYGFRSFEICCMMLVIIFSFLKNFSLSLAIWCVESGLRSTKCAGDSIAPKKDVNVLHRLTNWWKSILIKINDLAISKYANQTYHVEIGIL